MTAIWKHGRLQGWQRGDTFLPLKDVIVARPRVGNAACNNLNCGDLVVDVNDERHEGKVMSIHWGTARICWSATSWISDVDVHDLRKV